MKWRINRCVSASMEQAGGDANIKQTVVLIKVELQEHILMIL
jgi:hypothetical protein